MVFQCTLKKDRKNGTFVFGQRRFYGVNFWVSGLANASMLAVRKLCDVKEIPAADAGVIESPDIPEKDENQIQKELLNELEIENMTLKKRINEFESKVLNSPNPVEVAAPEADKKTKQNTTPRRSRKKNDKK